MLHVFNVWRILSGCGLSSVGVPKRRNLENTKPLKYKGEVVPVKAETRTLEVSGDA